MSRWSDSEAATYIERYADDGKDLALRVYTSRLLGRDPSLVLHGGGNTSVKTTRTDELGRELPVLCVKGSGWDLAEIEPAGHPAVHLTPLLDFRALPALSDEDMVNGVRRNLLSVSSPNPSVETLLHAFLPHTYIDHTHADAVLALADQEDAETLCREVYGDRMGIVPYIMPGFALAKKAAEVYEADPSVEGLILINHGIFTFGATARESYERMITMVRLAEEAILERQPSAVFGSLIHQRPEQPCAEALATLRGKLSGHPEGIGPVVLETRTSPGIRALLARADLADLTARGPITPDHIIRTKKKPAILPAVDDPDFAAGIDAALARYVTEYHAYFLEQVTAKAVARTELHPLPIVFLIPGLGLVTMGTTAKAARIAADLYEHTVDTLVKAEAIGRYTPLTDDHLFDMEYWSLEQAKLGKKQPKPLEGRICLISGAAGGIGAATARTFAAAGCNLILTDREAEPLNGLAASISGVAVHTEVADMTDAASVKEMVVRGVAALGGLDIVVSNAGTAPMGPIEEAGDALADSLAINLMSHQFLASASTELMRAQGIGGCLLFNASKSAFNPGPGFGAYSIPKAALIALMKQYAVEMGGHGIRAAAVNADRVRTPLLDMDAITERARARGLSADQYFRSNLLGREVTVDDVARAFYQLALAEKSTGTVMTVDGGNIAASPR